MNTLKTGLLLGALTGLLMLIGGWFGGQNGVVIAFLFAMAMNFGSYWFSDKIVLRMYHAQPVSESEAPELYRMVKDLALRASMPMPRVYIIPEETPNAFATGRNEQHAVVAVTEGLLRILSRDELEGVLSHEMTHIRNRDILIGSIAATLAGVFAVRVHGLGLVPRDILIGSIAATLAGAIVMLANMAQWTAMFGGGGHDDDEGGGGNILGLIVMAMLAPIAATLIQMAISRSREFLADEGGARISGKPYSLAGALEKLSQASRALPMHANPSTAHMFIVNPLTGRSLMNLFSTHPPIEERIARLRSMRPS